MGAGTPVTTASTSPQTYPSQAGCQPCTAATAIMMVAALRNADAGLPIELSTNFHRRAVWLANTPKAEYWLCSLQASVPIFCLLSVFKRLFSIVSSPLRALREGSLTALVGKLGSHCRCPLTPVITDSEAEAELRLLEDAEAAPEAEDSCRLDSGSALSADMKQSAAGQREGERRHIIS